MLNLTLMNKFYIYYIEYGGAQMNKNKAMRLGSSLYLLFMSAASVVVGCLAWFTFNRTASSNGGDVYMEQYLGSFQSYYYKGNYTTNNKGEKTYSGYVPEKNQIFATSFDINGIDGDFIKIDEGIPESSKGSIFSIEDLFPNTRYTFAFVAILNKSAPGAALHLTEYTSPNSLTSYSNDHEAGICLSEAISIKADAFPFQYLDVNTVSNDVGTSLNNATSNFLNGKLCTDNSTSLEEKFGHLDNNNNFIKEYDNGANFNGALLASASNIAPSNKAVLFLLTIEFSNDKSTYYKHSGSSGDISYYNKDISGDSNCYSSLDIAIKKLVIRSN